MTYLRRYGAGGHIYIPILKVASTDFAVGADWTPSAGDVKISKDGGAAANVANLPAAIAMGNGAVWDFSITTTESQAAHIVVTVADSAVKAVQDTWFDIDTYGNASSQLPDDFSDRAGTAQAVSGTTITLAASASSSDDYFNGDTVWIVSATTGADQSRVITDYVGSTRVATIIPAWGVTPTGTIVYATRPLGIIAAQDYATTNDITSLSNEIAEAEDNIIEDTTQIKGDLPIKLTKNTAFNNFKFYLVQSANPLLPATGLTVTCQRAIDDGAFANCTTATATEISGGWYRVNLSADDLNGDSIAFKFTAAGAVQAGFTCVPQPT